MRKIGGEKTGTRATFAIDHDDELRSKGRLGPLQFLVDSCDARDQVRFRGVIGQVITRTGPHGQAHGLWVAHGPTGDQWQLFA